MSFRDYFDFAFCINLDRRTDRWAQAQNEFKKINLPNVNRFSAIDGTKLGPVTAEGLPAGANGCRVSHLLAIRYAAAHNVKSLLILEDDVEFKEDFNFHFESLEPQIPRDFDFLYLGYNNGSREGSIKRVSENIDRISGKYTTHALIMRSTIFEQALNYLTYLNIPADVSYSRLQRHCNAYAVNPNLAFQSNGFSDIENSEIDYNFLKET
jgi:GR25 family glycosyltransferase involved in LPS biosynthesis